MAVIDDGKKKNKKKEKEEREVIKIGMNGKELTKQVVSQVIVTAASVTTGILLGKYLDTKFHQFEIELNPPLPEKRGLFGRKKKVRN